MRALEQLAAYRVHVPCSRREGRHVVVPCTVLFSHNAPVLPCPSRTTLALQAVHHSLQTSQHATGGALPCSFQS